ncbi:MAG: phosphate acyltransferase PlsX [Chlamydiae bacterium]|nr:phosphate acyltransferase PlsX [Chlamydiota bacterium]MBI3266740.1 phosphate acyltransferase PlsX [Chlamydiota bacterium]
MSIAIDAMGGDYAPKEIVEGTILAAQESSGRRTLILVGDPKRIHEFLDPQQAKDLNIEIRPASEVIHMHETPVAGLRKKKDSSIARAVELVKKGQAEAVVSAGNTGACVAATKLKLRFLKGIDRPAIATVMPNLFGTNILIDAGATVDCSPEHLIQFAVMGMCYAKYVLKKENPRIGLLNVGEEESKGNHLTKETFKILRKTSLNFVGNVEGRDVFRNVADVTVTDGFVGNVALKAAEGSAKLLQNFLKQEIVKSWPSKLGALLMKKSFERMKRRLDYAEYGGAPLLGVDGVCIISHGRSNAKAMKNAIRVADEFIQNKVNRHIEDEMDRVHRSLLNEVPS